MIYNNLIAKVIILFVLVSSVNLNADQGGSWLQCAMKWWGTQEQIAYKNKLGIKAHRVVGGTAQQFNLSDNDRQQCQRIIMALHALSVKPGNERLLLGLKERGGFGTYASTDLKPLFDACDNKDDVIDVVHAVYESGPGLEFCVHHDISVETRSRAIEEILTQIQLIQRIKALGAKEKAALIEQIKAQGQEELIQTVEGIHAMPTRKAKVIISRLASTGLDIEANGIVHTDMQKWNSYFATWLQHSAASLNPGAPVPQDVSREVAAFERMSRRYNRLRSYDHHIKRMEEEILPEWERVDRNFGDELRQANYPTREDYHALGANGSESLANIRRKKFQRARQTHPDKTGDEDTTDRMTQINEAFSKIENLRQHPERINDFEFSRWLALTRASLAYAVPDRLAKLKAEREAYARLINRDEADRFNQRNLPAPKLIGKGRKFPFNEFGVQPFVRRTEEPTAGRQQRRATTETDSAAMPHVRQLQLEYQGDGADA